MKKRKAAKWFVYILKCGDDSYYTGITNNLEDRLEAHRNGTGSKYVKAHGGPRGYMYTRRCSNRSEASKLEIQIKRMKRADKYRLIIGDIEI